MELPQLAPLLQSAVDSRSDWDKVEDWLGDHGVVIGGIALFVIVAILFLERIVPRLVRVTAERRLTEKPDEEVQQRVETLSHVFSRTGAALLVFFGFLTALPELGVNIGALLAGFGIAGIAVGFGAQSMVKDFLAGVFILVDNQYSRGDVVQIAGVSGVVENVGLRRTVIRDLDGIVHWVPNGEISVASNFTEDYSRVNMNVGVSYSEDLDHVIRVINRVGEELAADPDWRPHIITAPKVLRVDGFGDSSIDIKILGDTRPIQQWAVMGELRLRLKKAFDEEGIEIPYPHQVQVTVGAKAWDIPRGGATPEGSTEAPRNTAPPDEELGAHLPDTDG
jgi:small conductance mechanosensitive channel